MTNTNNLLPCPCCGGGAEEMGGYTTSVKWIMCLKCGLETKGFDNTELASKSWNTRTTPPDDVRAVVDERTPQDYAIEHAEYLAAAADGVQEAYKAYSLAQMNVDEGGDEGEDELAEVVDSARQDLHEALHNLRNMTYEFRKRRDCATPQ
ncbi:Lar family restriction alleviation protein [Pseudomonas abietaniphila]|uniref:Restriction alleviation protein Lar n=1 Tax=Pseudomonas abietaniphila TaxID=89065 RepID=A0A1G8TGG3_9PSED|nr:Lar family restriction alleviation protein [Pseudomonas abietaniphila]SDJ40523.1 Restriction alleviation protein Lar [Pseudomonas abietaniphila]